MNFEFIIALLLIIESNGRYLLININIPPSPSDNAEAMDFKSYARSRRLEFHPKKFHKKFRSIDVRNFESGKKRKLILLFSMRIPRNYKVNYEDF